MSAYENLVVNVRLVLLTVTFSTGIISSPSSPESSPEEASSLKSGITSNDDLRTVLALSVSTVYVLLSVSVTVTVNPLLKSTGGSEIMNSVALLSLS